MTYQNVWWTPNVEYGAGLNMPKTWPTVMEQYRRPKDERQYDLPLEPYDWCKLYYERPRMGKPTYRGYFRDHPWTVTDRHPQGIDNKPAGFHGRLYYEQGQQFKYDGPPKNDLYWLERPPFLPVFPRPKSHGNPDDALRVVNVPGPHGSFQKTPRGKSPQLGNDRQREILSPTAENLVHSYKSSSPTRRSGLKDRITQDGVGFL